MEGDIPGAGLLQPESYVFAIAGGALIFIWYR